MALASIFKPKKIKTQDKSAQPAQLPPQPVKKGVAIETKPKILDPVTAVLDQNMDILDVLAPNRVEVDFDFIKINNVYLRALFVSGYPRFVSPGWLEQVINFNSSLDISFFIYPIEAKGVLDDLLRKVAEMEAEIATDLERGKIIDPATEAKLEDARLLQEELVKGAEHFFEFGFYIMIRAVDLEQLNHITKQIEGTLGSLLINAKHATLDMDSGLLSSAPFGLDRLSITRNMDTTSLATTFPLTSAELSGDRGILYGINSQNGSFIIFDRFSLENSNMTVFATSGAGKTAYSFTPVLYQNREGQIKLDTLGKIIQTLIKKSKLHKIDNESEGVLDPGIKVYTFNNKLKGNWSNVQIAARKLSPKNLYKITTKSGREIITTGDHNFVVLKNSLIQIHRTDKTRVGMYIPLPRQLTNSGSQTNFLNARKFVKSWPNNIPAKISLKKELLTLLGLITSEGYTRSKVLAIYNSDPKILRIIETYSKKLGFNVTPIYKLNKRGLKILRGYCIVPNHLAKLVYELGGSGCSGEKRVPGIIFSLHNNQIIYFLSAYFEGDGGVDGHEISATTKSKNLASDLSYLLLRFGIIARIGKTKKAATNTINKTKRTYYRIRISGQDNLNKFVKNIGFISKEKNKKAKKLLYKTSNTNVDVIPELESVFKEIYGVLYSSSEVPAPKKFSEIKLGMFHPSPQELQKMILEIEKRIDEFENLENDGLLTLKSLPSVGDILEKGKEKNTNTMLWKKLGKSWWTLKHDYPPKLTNALHAVAVTHGQEYTKEIVTDALYRSFHITGESLLHYDKPLWDAIINRRQNPIYQKVINARDYISEKYEIEKIKLLKIKEKLAWLKVLANSDLYWDEIVKVEKIKSKHKYVYDLQVENGVFLAGHGGMFIHNSYFVKLESVRSLMLGTEVIIIDPEGEYKALTEAVGGQYISFSFGSPSKINPFDLSQVYEEKENQLGLKILSLHSLFKVIMGPITPIQEALLDRALVATYRGKGITTEPETQKKEAPLMEDLYKILLGMETQDALDMAARIEKFVRGSFLGIFDKQTNVDIKNPFTVFSVRELQDVLRPIAMFVILDFIWTRIKKDLKPRLMVVDEAWHMMRYTDSAQFLWSIVKRARKYFLGLTTITQDVEDFLVQDIGKAIVTNSALRVLFKQSPAAIDKVGDVFYLSQGERQLLLGANVGEGIFFAGNNHAPITVVASPEEHKLITTRPQDLIQQQALKTQQQSQNNNII
ncbi:MAG: Type IV secretory pathway VirB4 component-like protein [Candidatus Woesebacteria bacterium GW2011_GWB1_38_8]|uniref:Type IV secretory pathway VirB4 component-like protein n=1 Tax=Candidatus Woesebacteria bacterium GW2011_GWB1_38_8 TaxID=1618570 RepID=A0A0G0P8I2_9BACT|nr:MAG: Type IV secretory pathway VirB4 component-like protein [Candidatus Woesebacteria bacterium GW2011_GWB1_38_8]